MEQINIDVLYEDNHIIAVWKPAGILAQSDDSKEKSLFDLVKEYLKIKYKKPGNVFLGLVHRLDRPVSGIMLFAKTSKGASRLSEQFRNGVIEKKYTAIVHGSFQKQNGNIESIISKDESSRKSFIRKTANKHSKEAFLSYKVIKKIGENSVVEVYPQTGKFHQIRAQMASIGHPIIGDVKYGSNEKLKNGEIMLSASAISFYRATEDELINLHISVKMHYMQNWTLMLK
jgi:23S rRNA pseudouridine1911/1915/1917 synthase